MQIDEVEQNSPDFDWFAVDEQGLIAHFATAGFKLLPGTVSSSAEDLATVTSYFLNRAPVVSGAGPIEYLRTGASPWRKTNFPAEQRPSERLLCP